MLSKMLFHVLGMSPEMLEYIEVSFLFFLRCLRLILEKKYNQI